MNLDLDPESLELRSLFDKVGRSVVELSAGEQWARLHAAGLLDVVGPGSADPQRAEVNAVVVLEALAAAGIAAPVAETMWAAAQPGLVAVDGWVCAPATTSLDGARLVPFAAVAAAMAAKGPDGVTRLVDVPVDRARLVLAEDHGWLAGPDGRAAFEEMAGGFAWRAAAAQTVGACSAALATATEHARTRVQFGRPIGSFQAVQFRIAECFWRIEGLRLLVRESAWRADRGDPRADPVSALAWTYARECGVVVSRHVHQVLGALGFTRELGVVRLTGAMNVLRACRPAPPTHVVLGARRRSPGDPPSTVLGGFATGAAS